MAAYYLSDTHLRLDRPSRGERLARFVGGLGRDDTLTVAGDLCDFWFASRQRSADPIACPGLRSLADFRERGGALTILTGNHDAWLGPLYERSLGARVVAEPIERTDHGVRVHVVHGHLLGARRPWKALMESRAFLDTFAALPPPVARRLAARLEASNTRRLEETHRRHLVVYREHARSVVDAGAADLVLFGHVHEVYDEPVGGGGRLVVLGDWIAGSSYVRIDDRGVRFTVDRPAAPTPGAVVAP